VIDPLQGLIDEFESAQIAVAALIDAESRATAFDRPGIQRALAEALHARYHIGMKIMKERIIYEIKFPDTLLAEAESEEDALEIIFNRVEFGEAAPSDLNLERLGHDAPVYRMSGPPLPLEHYTEAALDQ
jgi:hypothetical protein